MDSPFEQYYNEHFPYMPEEFIIGHWYVDNCKLLYIHPCGTPLQYRWEWLTKNMTVDEFLPLYLERIRTHGYCHGEYVTDDITEIASTTFIDDFGKPEELRQLVSTRIDLMRSLNELIGTRVKQTKLIESMGSLDTLHLHKKLREAIKDMKYIHPIPYSYIGHTGSHLCTGFGIYDAKDKYISMYTSHNQRYLINVGDYGVELGPDFSDQVILNWVHHLCHKFWATTDHILLLHNAFRYARDPECSLNIY